MCTFFENYIIVQLRRTSLLIFEKSSNLRNTNNLNKLVIVINIEICIINNFGQ